MIFGGTGDLAARKLLPAMFHRFVDGQIPDTSRIIGIAREATDDDGYRAQMRKALSENGERQPEQIEAFLKLVGYRSLDARKDDGWDDFAALINERPDNVRVFYLSTSPNLFIDICTRLGHYKLNEGESRVVLEKPIGRDLESANQINDAVGQVFDESQTYRIDHYLGKETVQNLLALRFGNALFEPLWNAEHIDHVQITVAETLGVGNRAAYYDGSGALRDMVQNHMLQLVCMVAMEPPSSLSPDAVRDEKLKVLRSLKPIERVQRRPAHRARPVPRRRGRGPERAGLPGGTGRRQEPHRNLRRAEGRDRQLALGRRAVLPAHRQAPARARVGDRGGLQGGAAFDLRLRPPVRWRTTAWCCACSRTRASSCG